LILVSASAISCICAWAALPDPTALGAWTYASLHRTFAMGLKIPATGKNGGPVLPGFLKVTMGTRR
jgi:hypothetical protein